MGSNPDPSMAICQHTACCPCPPWGETGDWPQAEPSPPPQPHPLRQGGSCVSRSRRAEPRLVALSPLCLRASHLHLSTASMMGTCSSGQASWGAAYCGSSHGDGFCPDQHTLCRGRDRNGAGGLGHRVTQSRVLVRPSAPASTTGSLTVSAGPWVPGWEEAVLNLKALEGTAKGRQSGLAL